MKRSSAFLYLVLVIISYVLLGIIGALIIKYITEIFTFNSLVTLFCLLPYLLLVLPVMVYFLMERLPFKAKELKAVDIENYEYDDKSK